MDTKEIEKQVIANYQQDEEMMVLVFAQWCINNNLDPVQIYKQAYPNQLNNSVLHHAMNLTVPKDESDYIANDTLLAVLTLFGNEDLAYTISQEIEKLNDKK